MEKILQQTQRKGEEEKRKEEPNQSKAVTVEEPQNLIQVTG